jgi:hypothetical protein
MVHFASTPEKGDRMKTKKHGSAKGQKGKMKVLNLKKETLKDLTADKDVKGGQINLSLAGPRGRASRG